MSERGYSLFEVLIVLAIAAVIMLAAAPAIGSTVERMTLRSDVRSLTTELRRLRDIARDRQSDIVITLAGDGSLSSTDGSAIVLAPGTVAQLQAASGATTPARLVIAWDGTISGGIRLTRGRTSADIGAEPLTGRIFAQGAR